MADGRTLPRPSPDNAVVVVDAPGNGPGFWAGGPSVTRTEEGTFWLAYRLRRPVGEGRGYANVIARSEDGVAFETVSVLGREAFECDSLERPTLVALTDGTWRLFVSCATPGTRHWRVDALEAADPGAFDPGSAVTVLTGDELAGDRLTGVKDPVVQVHEGEWHIWLCCHPLDRPDDTDRMSTRYGTSSDGWVWKIGDVALAGTPGRWDQRAPGSPRSSAPRKVGWPITTVGPPRRRTPRNAPAWPPVVHRGIYSLWAMRWVPLPTAGVRCATYRWWRCLTADLVSITKPAVGTGPTTCGPSTSRLPGRSATCRGPIR